MHRARPCRHVLAEAVEGPDPLLVAGDEPRVPQPGEVVAHGRLAEVERGGEVTHADRLAGRLEQVEHLYPRRVGEGPVDGGELVRGGIRQQRRQGDTAALDPAGRSGAGTRGGDHGTEFTY